MLNLAEQDLIGLNLKVYGDFRTSWLGEFLERFTGHNEKITMVFACSLMVNAQR
jgi:hypothetical protein